MADPAGIVAPFERLDVFIPDYTRPGRSRPSQPFSTAKHDLFRRETLGSSGDGDGRRTDYFKRHLVRIYKEIGRPVPYRFIDAEGNQRSMDGGCLKFVGPDGQGVAEFIYDEGYIVAVRPKPGLVAQYGTQQALSTDAQATRSAPVAVRSGELEAGSDKLDTPGSIPPLAENLPFDLFGVVDERRKQESLRVIREGAAVFRKSVLGHWRRCAVTRSKTRAVLEAAHLHRYLGPKTNDIRNAIALRADIHVLFDKYMIGLRPVEDGLVVVLSQELAQSEYASLHDRRIKLPSDPFCRPDPDILRYRFDLFEAEERKRATR